MASYQITVTLKLFVYIVEFQMFYKDDNSHSGHCTLEALAVSLLHHKKRILLEIFNCMLLQGFWKNTTKQDVNGEDFQVLKTSHDYWTVTFLHWFLAHPTGRLQ
jgi:hypothetical protein